MYPYFQGIPNLPDLTHANELMEFGSQILEISLDLAIFVAGLGIVIAAIAFSTKRPYEGESARYIQKWVENYLRILGKLPHLVMILSLAIGGFFLSSTLANRYHHWEQQRIQQVAATVAGDRLEQATPRIRYTVVEPYTYYNWVATETKPERDGTRFTWFFEDNVSVKNPFGVFTATDPVRNTGILPRLLLLAPAVFLWWIMLLYFSVPLNLRDVAIAGGIFFACLLTLTYFSRVMDVKLAWSLISPLMLALIWGLGKSKSARLAALIATIAGGILPIFGLIVTYSGFTLSIAGLLSVTWLAVHNWYGIKSQI